MILVDVGIRLNLQVGDEYGHGVRAMVKAARLGVAHRRNPRTQGSTWCQPGGVA